MKKQQIINCIGNILILLICGNLQAQESFLYGEKYCANYKLEVQVAGSQLSDLKKIVVDFNKIKQNKIEFRIKLSDLKMGLDQSDCKKVKSKSHDKDNYIEFKDSSPSQTKSIIEWKHWSNLRVGNKNEESKESTLIGVVDVGEIKEKVEEIVTIAFQINNKTGKIQDVEEVKIPLVVMPLKKTTPAVATNDKIDSIVAKTTQDMNKQHVGTGTVVELTKTEEAQILWEQIIEASEDKQLELLRKLTWQYRTNYDVSYSNYETAWYYSIRYAKDKNEQKAICYSYNKQFSNGQLKKEIAEICDKKENKTTKQEEQDEIGYWVDEILLKNTPEGYQEYLKKYREKGVFISDAQKKIEEFSITEKERSQYDSISFMMKYAYSGNEMQIPIVEILEGENYILDTIRPTELGVDIRLQADKSARFRFSVPDSPWKVVEVEIDVTTPPLHAEIIRDEANKIIHFKKMKDGKPPYRIELINFDEGRVVRHFELLEKTENWDFRYDTLQQLVTGNYKLRLKDQTGINNSQFVTDSFFVEIISPKPWWMYFLPAAILSLLAGALFYKWNSKRKNDRRFSSLKRNEEEKKAVILELQNTANVTKGASIRKRITVHGKRDVEEDKTLVTIDNLLANGIDYLTINLNDLWEKSTISTVFIHPKCVEQIDDFAFKNASIHLLAGGAMPEIGGFLLGKYVENEGQFQLTLEEFIDIESEDNNVYQISFGAKAWSKLEKEMEQEKNASYKLIGWFHTHPGHGLFLSRPDLNIHHNFFNRPFQFAMEIDNVKSERNPTYDVGFFTQQPSGEINNVKLLKDSWFQWSMLYK